MPTDPLQTDTGFCRYHYAQTQLPFEDYPAIHYCKGLPPSASSYTEDAQLIFLLHGILKINCGKEGFVIRPNQLVLLKKNIWIEITGPDGEDLQYIRFTIKSDLVREFTKMSALPVIRNDEQNNVLVTAGGQGWMPYFVSLEPILLDNYRPQPGLIKLKMLELLFHLSRTNSQLLQQLLDIRDRYRINITDIVEENITSSLSIGQLAVLSGRSLSSFRRDFMAIYHMPPSEWIRLKRLEKAKELLLSTTMTITDVCYTLGFDHLAHFSRLFKSHFGYAPSHCKMISSETNTIRNDKSSH